MNERIRELLIQSEVFNKDGTVLKDVTGYELNKFAELIVAECVGVADRSNVTSKSIVGERIKEHFGVEE